VSGAGRDRRILDVVRSLGQGEVVCYGDIAADAGYPGRARLVGRLLAEAADDDLPWWRVVTRAGRLVPGLEAQQEHRLADEGVIVQRGRVRSAPFGRFSRPGR
jgi:methylated-DNA-protein-cysteine methyltransferase-like protein